VPTALRGRVRGVFQAGRLCVACEPASGHQKDEARPSNGHTEQQAPLANRRSERPSDRTTILPTCPSTANVAASFTTGVAFKQSHKISATVSIRSSSSSERSGTQDHRRRKVPALRSCIHISHRPYCWSVMEQRFPPSTRGLRALCNSAFLYLTNRATNACDRTLVKGASIRVELLLLRSSGSPVLFAKMNFRLIDVVRAHAGNYPRLHGLRTNLTGLTASALCRFGARCRYR
jgi:hypothetical protein